MYTIVDKYFPVATVKSSSLDYWCCCPARPIYVTLKEQSICLERKDKINDNEVAFLNRIFMRSGVHLLRKFQQLQNFK